VTSDPSVSIRPARLQELTQVLELWAAARSTYASTADTGEALRALLERDAGSLLVAELDGLVVGTLIAAWDGWRGNMYRLAVQPEHRRRGIARRLLAAGEERLRRLGARRISVLVWREDERAVGTWLGAGYQHDEGTGRFVKNVPA
jgi:ribosomal protein S18 acetylase RimI-like enzyme